MPDSPVEFRRALLAACKFIGGSVDFIQYHDVLPITYAYDLIKDAEHLANKLNAAQKNG